MLGLKDKEFEGPILKRGMQMLDLEYRVNFELDLKLMGAQF